MAKQKVTVVGAGHVGATVAQRLVENQLADVALVDIVEGLAQGKALDMMQSAATLGFDTTIVGSDNYEHTNNSDVIIVTAGIARKPGMSRDDLLTTNQKIVTQVVKETIQRSPNAIYIVVSNPLDVMTFVAWQTSGLPANRVVGMAGVLDSSRYAAFIAEAIDCSIKDVRAMVLGGHGDSMVPVPEYSTVNGVPITQLLSADVIDQINERTKHGGAEIVSYLKTGSAYYAPAASAVAMAESILLDANRLLPACAYVTGEYGIENVYCGVPVVLNRHGVERIVEIELRDHSYKLLHQSAKTVKELCEKIAAVPL
jgi:malate dehydrogenase